MFSVLHILLIILNAYSIPIENDLFGEIQIECDARTISIQVKTERPFVGNIFVNDFATDEICMSKGTGRLSAFLEFEIGFCGALRQRTLVPKGTVVHTTVTVSFHPYFITKVDRTYHILCLYKESKAPVNNYIQVDELIAVGVTENFTMPTCTYQILRGGPFGQPVRFGIIGQQVYHQWKCESEDDDSFCMIVHTCSADDGHANLGFLIDSNGCAIDKFLLSNIEYPENLLAGQEAHVYKFADRDALYFQCQISITVKLPGEDCIRPICADTKPEGGGAPVGSPPPYGSQKKLASFQSRSKRMMAYSDNIVDVRTRFSVGNHIKLFSNKNDETCVLLSTISIPCILIYLLIVVLTFFRLCKVIHEICSFADVQLEINVV